MSQDSLWFGFLDIGEKGSPVVRDSKLETGKADTIYLFNLKRNAIIEYKRDIVESKLRELNKDENGMVKELKSAFNKVAAEFTPRPKKPNILDIAPVAAASNKKSNKKNSELENVDDDFDDDVFDDDDED